MRRIILVLMLLITGCVANSSVITKNYDFQNIGTNKGIVILSITNNDSGYYRGGNSFAPTITITNVLTSEETYVEGMVGTLWEKHILNNEGFPIGRVVALELEEGLYSISNFKTMIMFNRSYSAKHRPNVEFKVVSGMVTYAGNVNFYIDESAGMYQISVTNQARRDLEDAKNKWTNLKLDDVVIDIAENKTHPALRQ